MDWPLATLLIAVVIAWTVIYIIQFKAKHKETERVNRALLSEITEFRRATTEAA